MIGKCCNIHYNRYGSTKDLRGWLFWWWCFSLDEMFNSVEWWGSNYGTSVGIRIFGWTFQRIGR